MVSFLDMNGGIRYSNAFIGLTTTLPKTPQAVGRLTRFIMHSSLCQPLKTHI